MKALPATTLVLLALLLGCGPVPQALWSAGRSEPEPVALKAATVAAFDRYVRLTDTRNEAELQQPAKQLWTDSLDEAARKQAFAALKRNEVKITRLETKENSSPIGCPNGLIHHWVGAIFIPDAKLADVLSVLQDYDHHSQYYSPDVERSKLLQRDGDRFRAFLRFRRHKVITVVLDTEHDVHYFRDASDRAHSRSSATRIAEVQNAGKADEREKTPGDDGGFLWRMETWWRMVERDGGVYLQSEVVSLTRDIPTGLGWLVGPFVNSIPRESLTFTLEATRRAVANRLATGEH